MSGPFRKLHHVCVVVHDIDAAQRYYESVGIGPWQDFPPFTDLTELDVPDREAFLQLVYRFATVGDIQIQLCQPGDGDTHQRRFIDAHGEGVFHLGFDVPDADAADAASDLELLIKGRRANGSGFSYYDTAEHAGVVLQIRQSPPPEAPPA